MSNRPLAPATRPVPPATDPIGPLAHHARTELATAHHFAAPPSPRPVRSSSVEAADNLCANPRLYGALRRAFLGGKLNLSFDGKSPGQPSKLNDVQRQAIVRMIESGPIPAIHGVVRWRLIDLSQWIYVE